VRLLLTRATADRRVRFLFVGGASAVLELSVFWACIHAFRGILVSNVISFTCVLLVSFAGYRAWSFAGEHVVELRRQLAAYSALALVNLALTSAIISALVHFYVMAVVAKACSMILAALWNYFLMNRLIFRRRTPETGQLRSMLSEGR
jgi:putative flippase GtrA